MIRNKVKALDYCPYCNSKDINITENRPERDHEGDMVCQDYSCFTCNRVWTVEYRPVCYFKYENEEFLDSPISLSAEVEVLE